MFDSFLHRNINFDGSLYSKMAHWIVITACVVLFLYAINTPEQNWDILGYSGSAVSIENSNETYIHNYVYKELKLYATNEEFVDLTERYKYRRVMFKDSEAFHQQIPFYKIRIIYVLLILALMKIGINIFLAAHIISAFLVSAGCMVFYYAYKKNINPVFWVSYPLFIIIFDVVNIAQTVTADSLAFFWMGLITFALVHAHWKSLFLLLISLTLVRTDMIILVALFSGYFILFREELRFLFTAVVLISLALYFLINHLTGNYGWSAVFHYVFITGMEATHPDEYSSFGINLKQYMTVVVTNLPQFLSERTALLFEILVFLQFIMCGILSNNRSVYNMFFDVLKNTALMLTLASVIYIVLHYFIFPILYARFFAAQYIISALGFLSITTSTLERLNSDSMNAN